MATYFTQALSRARDVPGRRRCRAARMIEIEGIGSCCRAPAASRRPAGAKRSTRRRGSSTRARERVGQSRAARSHPQAAGLAPTSSRGSASRATADLVLHLPLRYEDHTRLVPLARSAAGAVGADRRRGRQHRHPVPAAAAARLPASPIRDDRATRSSCCASSRSIRASRRRCSRAQRVRVFGDVRPGYFGLEIVHPQWKVVDRGAPLPDRLTPVYPTTAGLAQETLRKVDRAGARGRSGAHRRHAAGRGSSRARKLWKFGDAVRFLHAPPPRLSRARAAGARRAHASGVDAPQVRRAPRAAAVAQGASQGARRSAARRC